VSSWGIRVGDGTLEALKWLAVLSMTADHVNRALANGAIAGFSEFGRLACPLFGFVFGYNLARADTVAMPRIVARLVLVGAVALPFYVLALGLAWPLNILLTFAVAAGVVWIDRRWNGWAGWFGMVAFGIVGGAFVDMLWIGVAYVYAVYRWIRFGGAWDCFAFLVLSGLLALINNSGYGLLAVPAILLARRVNVGVPRYKRFFYAFYPLHLAILAALRLIHSYD
jgi:hypothetical protein